jgi:hypothetical protein
MVKKLKKLKFNKCSDLEKIWKVIVVHFSKGQLVGKPGELLKNQEDRRKTR